MKMTARTLPVIEVPNEGLVTLLDKKVMVECGSYFWTGILKGVNDSCIKLENPAKVFETGDFKLKKWKDEQPLNIPHAYLMIQDISAFYKSK